VVIGDDQVHAELGGQVRRVMTTDAAIDGDEDLGPRLGKRAHGLDVQAVAFFDTMRNVEIDLRVEQGMSIGRPSTLHLRAMRTSRGIEIRVGGGVVDVARGTLVAARFA
jgi:hypothetical protein